MPEANKIVKRYKPPTKIIALKNRDKTGWTESWSKKGKKDIGNFPHPVRAVLCGNCGRGKSTLAKNLILHQRPRYKSLYVAHLDADRTLEWKDMEPTQMLTEIPSVEFFDGKEKQILVIDDFEFTASHKERLRNIAGLFRYCSTHCNLSIYLCHQSFFDIPNIVKKMCNLFCIWEPISKLETTMIANRIGMEAKLLKKLFKSVITAHKSHLTVDLQQDSPAKYRKDIWEVIEINDSSDDDDDVDEKVIENEENNGI